MEILSQIIPFLEQTKLTASLEEVMLLIAFLSTCIFLGKNKLGLLGTYAFILYWGFIMNRGQLMGKMGENSFGLYIYAGLGIFLIGIVVIGIFRSEE